MSAPPEGLVRALVEGPTGVSGLEWHEVATSTNSLATEAAERGAAEVHVVVADTQTAGRGRQARSWHAPPGTSLLCSLLLRPRVPAAALPLLPLLAGAALAEAVQPFTPRSAVALKWPNDLLVDGRKAAGILVEVPAPGVAVVGVGCNVDWRAVDPPPAAPGGVATTCLARAAGASVDRWRILAAFLGVFDARYRAWPAAPTGFLDGYRRRCATLGQRVQVLRAAGAPLAGRAIDVDDAGALVLRTDTASLVTLLAGDVVHLRAAGAS